MLLQAALHRTPPVGGPAAGPKACARVLVVTGRRQQQGPAGGEAATAGLQQPVEAAAAAAGARILAALPAWGRPIPLPAAWSSELATLAGGVSSGSPVPMAGPLFSVWLDTPDGPAVATFHASQLLGSGGCTLAATLLSRSGNGSSSESEGGQAARQEGGSEEEGWVLHPQAEGRVQDGAPLVAPAALEQAAPAEERSDGKQGKRHHSKTKRAMSRIFVNLDRSAMCSVAIVSGGTCKQGLWACSSEPLRARLLAFAGVLVVVCATWLQLLIGSPIPAVAVLKSISFFLSCLAALAVLALLALMRLEAPPRRSAGGDGVGRYSAGTGAGAGGLEASAASEEGGGGRWWLTLLPAAAGSEAEGREVAGAVLSPAAVEGQ